MTLGQEVKIVGKLKDIETREPMAFANVALLKEDDCVMVGGAVSDLDGHFVVRVPKGRYLLRVSMVGYEILEQHLSVEGNCDLGTLSLRPGTMLAEVSVVASRPLFSTDGEKNIYSTIDDPTIQNGTTMDALQNAPGLETDAQGVVRLRGNQEVSIWINGRECRMNAEALKQYLKTLPANNIKQIEVISNPSARYGGGNPVVNIVMRDKTMENQFVSVGFNANSKPDISPWLSYIYNSERWELDLYANIAYAHELTEMHGNEVLMTPNGDTSRIDNSHVRKEERNVNTLFSMDLAYHWDSLTTAYLWVSAFPTWSGWTSSDHKKREELCYNPGDYSYVESLDKKVKGHPSLGMLDGVWIDYVFDDSTGRMLSAGYYGSVWKRDSLITGLRNYNLPALSDIDYHEQHKGVEWFHGFEANYSCPFGTKDSVNGLFSNELEFGFEGAYVHTVGTKMFDTLGANGYEPCSWLRWEREDYTAQGNLYVSLLHRWKNLSIKGGLRGGVESGWFYYPDAPRYDYTHCDYTLVPSLHISYSAPRNNSFSISFTRRRSIPSCADYSSRPLYSLDGYTIGNADLMSGKMYQMELKWDKYKDGLGSLGINLFYLSRIGSHETLTDVVLENDFFHTLVTFSQPINIGNAWNSGMDVHLVYRPNAFVNVKLNGTLFYDYVSLQTPRISYNNGLWCYALRMVAWMKLWNKVQLFATAYYNSPTQKLYCTMLSRKGVDLGVHADLLHHRMSINLSVNDVFDWNGFSTLSTNPNIIGNSETQMLGRYLNLGLTFRFGQLDLERQDEPSHGKRRGAL